MSGLILIGLAFICAGIFVWANEKAQQAAQRTGPYTFRANLKRGQIDTKVRFSYRDGDTEFYLEAERTITEWAAGMDIPELTPDHFKLLDSLLGEALAGYSPKVISIAVSGIPAIPTPEPSVPTEAERLDAEIVSNVNCVETAMNRLQWVQKEKPEVASLFLKGRTVERLVKDVVEKESDDLEDMVKRKLNGMFHDPNRVR